MATTVTNQEIIERGRYWSILMSKTIEDYTQSRQARIEKERIAERERVVNEQTERSWSLIESRITEIMNDFSQSDSDMSNAIVTLAPCRDKDGNPLDMDITNQVLNNVLMRMGFDCVDDEDVGDYVSSIVHYNPRRGYEITWNPLRNLLALAGDRSRLNEFVSNNEEDK